MQLVDSFIAVGRATRDRRAKRINLTGLGYFFNALALVFLSSEVHKYEDAPRIGLFQPEADQPLAGSNAYPESFDKLRTGFVEGFDVKVKFRLGGV